MVDRTTLPSLKAGESTEIGQRFVVRGYRFDLLPDELVLSYLENFALEQQTSYAILFLVEKTDTQLVFECQFGHTFQGGIVFRYLASPFDIPRSLVEYKTID